MTRSNDEFKRIDLAAVRKVTEEHHTEHRETAVTLESFPTIWKNLISDYVLHGVSLH